MWLGKIFNKSYLAVTALLTKLKTKGIPTQEIDFKRFKK